jgi:hypothetical protein
MCTAAYADEPLTVASLAAVDAAISFCQQVAPAEDGAYRSLLRTLVGTQSGSVLSGLRSAPDYQSAFNSVQSALGNLPSDLARSQCYAAVGGRDRDGDRDDGRDRNLKH